MRKFIHTGKVGKTLLRVEKMIVKDLEVYKTDPVNFEQKLQSRKLILKMNSKSINRSLLMDYNMIRIILGTRGRLRWLCFHLLPDKFSKSYSYNRWALVYCIVRNWSAFRFNVLRKLEQSEYTSGSFLRIDSYEYTHPEVSRRILHLNDYLLENGFMSSHGYQLRKPTKGSAPNNTDSLIFRMILKNSYSVKRFLQYRSYLLSSPRIIELLELFPDLQREIGFEKGLVVKPHAYSSLTFDERLEKISQNSDLILNAEVWHQRFIVKEDHWILIDATCSPEQDFVAGHWQFFEQNPKSSRSIFLRTPSNPDPLILEEAIYLIGRCDENWYHLLMDTLPRYLFLQGIEADIPILIRSDLPETTIEFLKRILPNPMILLDSDVLAKIARLHFVAGRSTTYDTIPVSSLPQVEFSPKTIAKTRSFILNSTRLSFLQQSPRRIYLPRVAKYRNLINGAQIYKTLDSAGLKRVPVDEDFFRHQHSYFNNADVIACPGGATLANMIFMSPDSKLLIFRSFRDLKQKLWSKLSIAANVNLFQFFGIPIYFGRKKLQRQHSDYFCATFILKYYLWMIKK